MDRLEIEQPYMVIKRWQLLLGFVLLLLGTGVQIGLAIARFDMGSRIDKVEEAVVDTRALRSEIQSLNVEAGKLRTEIEGLRRELDLRVQ